MTELDKMATEGRLNQTKRRPKDVWTIQIDRHSNQPIQFNF